MSGMSCFYVRSIPVYYEKSLQKEEIDNPIVEASIDDFKTRLRSMCNMLPLGATAVLNVFRENDEVIGSYINIV